MNILLIENNPLIADAISASLAKHKVDCEVVAEDDIESLMGTHGGLPYWGILVAGVDRPAHLIGKLRLNKVTAPILGLLEMRSTEDTIDLLSAGADDVLVKPVNGRELAARVRAVERRGHGHASPELTIGKITVHLDGRDPVVAGQRLKLSHREHSIFTHLALQAGKVVSKQSVYEAVYGMFDAMPNDKVIDVYICKLRKKIADATGGEHYIETVYGRGYKLDTPEKTVLPPSKVQQQAANSQDDEPPLPIAAAG